MKKTRQALQEKIERKEKNIITLIECIRDYGEKAVILMDDGDIDWALGKVDSISKFTKEIEQEREEIREIREQIRLIKYLMREGE